VTSDPDCFQAVPEHVRRPERGAKPSKGADVGGLPRRPPFVIPRRRARALLDRWGAVTVVHGLQGFGKTTLVAEWLRAQKEPVRVVWLSLTQGSHDDLASEILDALQQPSRPWADPGHTVLQALSSATQALPRTGRLALVLDDAHLLREVSTLRWLTRVVALCPQVHLVLCTRGHHRLEDLGASAVEIVKIPAERLLFTVEEVRQLALRRGVVIDDEDAERLHAQTGGWPAVVQSILDESPPAGQVGLGRGTAYVRDTVVAECPRRALESLLPLALTSRLTYRQLRDLTEHSRFEVLLGEIEASGLVERTYDRDDLVLETPRLVREALRLHFETRSPHAVHRMHRAMSRWYDAHDGVGHRGLALHHAVRGKDWDQVDALWREDAVAAIFSHPRTTSASLKELPPAVLQARPALRVGRAALRYVDRSESDNEDVVLRSFVRSCLQSGRQGLDRMTAHDMLLIGTGTILGLRSAGRLGEAARVAADVQKRAATRISRGDDPGGAIGWFYLHRGITHLLGGDDGTAEHSLLLAWEHRGARSSRASVDAASTLALTSAKTGERASARVWLDRAWSVGEANHRGGAHQDVAANLARGMLALDRLDKDTASGALEALQDDAATSELWPFTAWLGGQYALQYDDASTALSRLKKTETLHGVLSCRLPAAQVLLTSVKADLLLASGRTDAAHRLLMPLRRPAPMIAVTQARLHLITGRPSAAARVAAEALLDDRIDNRTALELMLLAALANAQAQRWEESRHRTVQALGLYSETRQLRPFCLVAHRDLVKLFEIAGRGLDGDDLAVIESHPSPFPHGSQLVRLTPRESLLATSLASAASRQEIADSMGVSVNTVRKQLATLYRKLGVRSRADAVARLADLGLTVR